MPNQQSAEMNIAVRLPNWLGDVVMSLGFLHVLRQAYPRANVTLVVKKGLEAVVDGIEGINGIITFSKEDYKGISGAWRFGKMLRKRATFDLFFILPDSFSAALIAYASGAEKRVGFRNEGRSFLLTNSFAKPKGLHRVEEYASLLWMFNKNAAVIQPAVQIGTAQQKDDKYIVFNINSEALSRRLPKEQAVIMLNSLLSFHLPVKLIGSGKEADYVFDVVDEIKDRQHIEVVAGKTNLAQLIMLIGGATLVVSTDSGPAHIASASGVPVVVLFGAGNESNTGPYHNKNARVVRYGKLPCEPCVKNKCQIALLPLCMEKLPVIKVVNTIHELLNKIDTDV